MTGEDLAQQYVPPTMNEAIAQVQMMYNFYNSKVIEKEEFRNYLDKAIGLSKLVEKV
jgi:hypothetical protein